MQFLSARSLASLPRLVSLISPAILATFLSGCAAESTLPPDEEDEPTLGTGEQALTANERTAYEYFVGKGLTDFQAAAIVGNLIQESNVLPGAVQSGGGLGRGIAQWSVGGRWDEDPRDNVVWYAGLSGRSAWSLGAQLDFIWYELQTFSWYGFARFRATDTVTEATIAFQDDFEGCGNCHQSTRILYAKQVLAAYGSGGGGGGGGGGTGETCYSSTLGKTMLANACVQSRSNRKWYQCDDGNWVIRWNVPAACISEHPL